MKKRIPIILFLIFLAGLTGCAPAVSKRGIDLVWPLPPDEPKIRFVDIIRTNADLGKDRSAADALFGEEIVVGLEKPYGVAVDREGKIYVTDIKRVLVFDLKKKDFSFIGNEPGTGQLRNAIGIAASSDGRIFVGDVSSDRVFVYVNGKFAHALGNKGEFGNASGIALDEKRGLIYIADSSRHVVRVYSLLDYSFIREIGQRGTGTGQFNFPTNITLDAAGRLYVVDTGNFRVQVFDETGGYLRSIGKLGDTPGTLARPKGIAIDSEGHIYVVDTAFQNFQIFDQEGKILLAVGGSGLEPGKFILPAGMTIDDEDRIYVVNQIPGSVQIFQYLGEKWKKKAEKSGTGDEKK